MQKTAPSWAQTNPPADEPALANAYRSGMINETNNLDRTAIIAVVPAPRDEDGRFLPFD